MADDFKERVKHSWEAEIAGNKLFKVIGKMNRLKAILIKLNKERFSDIERKTEHAMEELKRCQTELQGDKAPGPDSYTSQFFKDCWDTISKDAVTGVLEFFQKDCVTRNHLSKSDAFVAGRSIVQNVLICQDLEMLHALNFPSRFIQWIMQCITTTKYSIAINGGIYGNIAGKRGLRQGDPISPLIFVICMEYFTRIMQHVATMQGFEYHTKCRGLKLNHLCFVDDVLLFCKGEVQSVLLMLRGLAAFSEASGLHTNATKSNIYSANMKQQEVNDICELTGYKRGVLPFRYLGVPISAKKISAVDCEMLVEKMPKIEGGLGIIECEAWNQAAIAKYVWNIAKKQTICGYNGDQFVAGYTQLGWLKADGKYTTKSGYPWKQGRRDSWSHGRWVWDRNNIPKHSFICWLAMHRRLLTRERLATLGICQKDHCVICGEEAETIDHLFFECIGDFSEMRPTPLGEEMESPILKSG
uniref:Uncharacterized protein LOC104230578 n=1 Tax=Nicotiana sylvestris TaxID=4096 RepID=A0A1U7WP59_NICSY|nr:PREDICTED: uncharacterized protein LOC104230578 [Nicotiana sylvestris]